MQISAYVDTVLASLLPTGAVAAISYAQVLYTLPVSLFGMSVSAAELPAMSSATGDEAANARRGSGPGSTAGCGRSRSSSFRRRWCFVALGDVVAGALYQSGAFTREMTVYVWAILAGSAVGLLASTLGRLYSSTFYALHDTRTPLRFALVRVALTIVLGYLFAIHLPATLGVASRWGAAGITLASGLAGWVEFFLLRRRTGAADGTDRVPTSSSCAELWGSALAPLPHGLGRSARRRRASSTGRGVIFPGYVRRRLLRHRRRPRRAPVATPAGPARAIRQAVIESASSRGSVSHLLSCWYQRAHRDHSTHPEELQRKLDTLPEGPGVYLWRGTDGEVLYVGKAKRLRSRVRSYFATDFPDSPRNRLLQRLIADVETIVVPSEAESLILENNLIKEYRPRFNVRLKDDKSYPSIAVTLGEPFPRVLVTRQRDIPGARYFGPYTDVGQLRRTLAIIRRLYTVRSCHDRLPGGAAGASLSRLPHRPLPGALHGLAGRATTTGGWWTTWSQFLEGKTQDVRARVREAMLEASEREDYERARELRDALRWLDRLEEPVAVEVMGTGDADVIGYARDGDDAVGVLIRVRDGRVVGREHRFLEGVEEEEDSAVLSAFLVRYYVPVEDRARRLVVCRSRRTSGTRCASCCRRPIGRAAARHGAALARAGRSERAASAGEPSHRVVRDRGARRGSGVRAGPRSRAQRRAAELRLRRHLAQPGPGHGGLAGVVRGGSAAQERIPQVQDQGSGPAGRLSPPSRRCSPGTSPAAATSSSRYPT